MNISNDLKEFNVRMIEVGGKLIPVVQCQTENVVNSDGSKSVIIHAPKMSLINKKLKLQN